LAQNDPANQDLFVHPLHPAWCEKLHAPFRRQAAENRGLTLSEM
jgi:hypothetical protein